jgi:hypothetical protein
VEDKRWDPQMDDAKREELYKYWKKAVTRTFDWLDWTQPAPLAGPAHGARGRPVGY